MRHVVAVSGGKDSTCMALALRDRHPDIEYDYLITPTGNELPEMVDHWERLQTLLGRRFIALKPFTLGDGLLHLVHHFNALPNHRQRWCTRMLKIQPTVAWLKGHAPCVQYVGLRADEEEREGIYGDIPNVTQSYPLRDWGWGIGEVLDYLRSRNVRVPARTDCAWCYGQRLGEWYRLWRDHPDLYHRGEAVEFDKGHTFRSPSRDTWPAGLTELRRQFEAGRVPRGVKLNVVDDGSDDRAPCRVCSL